MKKYLVRFTTKSGDNDKEWCYAENKHQAAQQMRDEHWNIKSIDFVRYSCEKKFVWTFLSAKEYFNERTILFKYSD